MPACGAILGIEDLRARGGSIADDSGATDQRPPEDGGACLMTACERNDDSCSYCGHRCGEGSSCVDRACTPVDVATITGSRSPYACAFARDGERLYVVLTEVNDAGVQQNNVHAIVPSGELDPSPIVSVEALASVRSFVVHRDHFYLLGPTSFPSTGLDTLLSCPKAGSGCTELYTLERAGNLAVSGDGLFTTLGKDRSVVLLPTTSDAGLTTFAQDPDYLPSSLVGDHEAIYWRDLRIASSDGGAPIRVMRVATSMDGGFGAPEVLAEVDASVRSSVSGANLGVDDSHLFFGVTGALASLAKTGGAVDMTPIRGREDASVFLADVTRDRWLAFTESSSTVLYVGDRCGDPPIAIAADPTFLPGPAAAFEGYVYWCAIVLRGGSSSADPRFLRRLVY